jgi:3-deoxy-D-manno-octulosonic-acid transferase
MRTLYSIAIYCYRVLIHAASVFNSKAKLWVDGRKDVLQKIDSVLSTLRSTDSPLVWFHCASLGEFEQGRPLIEKYRATHPGTIILLTFFSPSGYEIRKNYKGADLICYLPIDTRCNAKQFLDIVKPQAAFFIKYEFWFNYLSELKKRNVRTYLVSGIFRENQHFFKWYGTWFRKQFNSFSHFYLQNENSEQLLNSIGFKNTTVVGDTRFDRVSEIVKNVKSISLIEQFKGNNPVFIAGSTWKEDEKLVSNFKFENFKLIIAPHEIDEEHIRSIEAKFTRRVGACLRYSQANPQSVQNVKVLIIDNIGMLSSLYQYGSIAFIGGGFGKGIHNILEAATFGLPLIFGPNYEKFTEAKELIKLGGAFSVSDKEEFEKIISLLQDEQMLKTASHICKYYVESRVGASDKILKDINQN